MLATIEREFYFHIHECIFKLLKVIDNQTQNLQLPLINTKYFTDLQILERISFLSVIEQLQLSR